ncbi:hypothetical protein ACFWPK_16900 [Nocardia sp. NPDC058519]
MDPVDLSAVALAPFSVALFQEWARRRRGRVSLRLRELDQVPERGTA